MKLRKLKAALPNGDLVAIDPFDRPTPLDEKRVEYAEILTRLLGNPNTPEDQLCHFLANATPVVFPNADPSSPPQITSAVNESELGVDLTFQLAANAGIAGVQLKSHRYEKLRRPDVLRHQIKAFSSNCPDAAIFYLIAGRRGMSEDAAELRQYSRVPFEIRSWDDVATSMMTGDNELPTTVILIEIATVSRRLLKRLVQEPQLLYGIDDRKFEEIIATLLFDLGLEDVTITETRAESRDIIATHVDPRTGIREVYFIECKHWVSGRVITARWAFKLAAVVHDRGATAGVLLSTSGFGPKLIEQHATFEASGVYLRDTQDITQWLSVWEQRYGQVLLRPVPPQDILGVPDP
jgi:hypothetical protein